VSGKKNLSRRWRFGILVGEATQRSRTGLAYAAPPALGNEDLGNGAAFLERNSEGKAKRADLKDQRYIKECREGKAQEALRRSSG